MEATLSREFGLLRRRGRGERFAPASTLANAWLLVFALDAACGIADAFLSGSTLLRPSAWRHPTAWIVMAGAGPLIVLSALCPRISKRTIAFPLLFLFWIGLGTLPFGLTLEGPTKALLVAFCQAGSALAAFFMCRRHNGGVAWLMGPATTGRPRLSLAYTIRFVAVAAIALPLAVVPAALLCAGIHVLDSTRGFLHVNIDGVYVEERRYTCGDKSISLVATIPVDDSAIYERVLAPLAIEGAVVLTERASFLDEGFGDLPNVLARTAQIAGLTPAPSTAMPSGLIVEEARIGTADLTPAGAELVDALTDAMSADDLAGVLRPLRPYLEPQRLGATLAAVEETRAARDRRLFERLEEVLTSRDVVILPRGVAQITKIESGILADGFVPKTRLAHRVVSFDKLFPRGAID